MRSPRLGRASKSLSSLYIHEKPEPRGLSERGGSRVLVSPDEKTGPGHIIHTQEDVGRNIYIAIKVQTPVTQDNGGNPHRHKVRQKNPSMKAHILYDSIWVKF